jgi:hypothetical protein
VTEQSGKVEAFHRLAPIPPSSVSAIRSQRSRAVVAVIGVTLFGLLCGVSAHRYGPYPTADSARASEDAFAHGLEEREFVPPMMGPGRWTTASASFEFENVPGGPYAVEVRVRNHRNTVRVLVEGQPIGLIPPGQRGGTFTGRLGKDGNVRIDLVVKPFLARAGRRLGTFLDRVTLVHERSLLPPLELALVFIGPALAILAATLVARGTLLLGVALSAVVNLTQFGLLLPSGVLRSPYAYDMAVLLACGAVVLALLSRACPWLFAALLAAFVVQVFAGLHPLVIGLDASFHGHNLAEVLAGDYFLESETQHKPPFRFPYGVSFYVLLLPLVRTGVDLLAAVRLGAAVGGVLASAATFCLVRRMGRPPWVAFLAVALLQFIPWTSDVYSNGNYSNIFAQSAVVGFLLWWALGKPLGWYSGAAVFALGALAHLSGFFTLVMLGLALVVVHRRELEKERTGLLALGIGFAVAAIYYTRFAPLMLGQLPRLFQGGHGGTGAQTALEALLAQFTGIFWGWGLPALILAWIGRPRGNGPIDRELRAMWLAGALLAALALITPVEVRYLYALTFPLSIAAGLGVARLLLGGLAARLAAALLVGAQVGLGARNIALAVLYDWRV